MSISEAKKPERPESHANEENQRNNTNKADEQERRAATPVAFSRARANMIGMSRGKSASQTVHDRGPNSGIRPGWDLIFTAFLFCAGPKGSDETGISGKGPDKFHHHVICGRSKTTLVGNMCSAPLVSSMNSFTTDRPQANHNGHKSCPTAENVCPQNFNEIERGDQTKKTQMNLN
jgi:hypothetical protein